MYLCYLHPGCYPPTGIYHEARRRVIIRDESLQQRLEASFQPNTFTMAEHVSTPVIQINSISGIVSSVSVQWKFYSSEASF